MSVTANQETDLSLIHEIRSGNRWAQETLVEKYVPMVKYIVRRHYGGFLEFEDLVQEGLIGLYSAICEYRPDRFDVKFSSFAYLCIQRKIYNAVKQGSGNKHRLLNQAVSLHTYVNSEETRTMFDYLADDSLTNDPTFVAEDRLLMEQLRRSLGESLSLLEHKVAFLLVDGYSIQDMEREFGLAPKQVDNARTRVKKKLRHRLERYGTLLDHPKLSAQSPRGRMKRTCLPTGS